jgi:hypothetical protein
MSTPPQICLFFNHKVHNCGVYQYGKRLFDILNKDNIFIFEEPSTPITYIYYEIDCYAEYLRILLEHRINTIACIYNYHISTMQWLNESTIQRNVKNIGIPHESPQHLFDIVCNIDPTAISGVNQFTIPRPLFENIDDMISTPITNPTVGEFINKYLQSNIPIFGSFGFGFDNKGFDRIVEFINGHYENAIIKFVIPGAYFDPYPERIHMLKKRLFDIKTKPGIILMISHEFFSTTEILQFLHSNTMNIFLYDTMYGRGISSTIDYAMSVKKPIGISDSFMFRHIYSDKICLYKNTVENCFLNSQNHLKPFFEKYSNKNICLCFRKILNALR